MEMIECLIDVEEMVGIILSLCFPCLSSSLAIIKCEKNFGVLAVRTATSLRGMG